MQRSPDLPSDHPAAFNIQAIAKLEEEALARRSTREKFSDAIVKVAGSTYFLFLNLALVVGWLATNLKLLPHPLVFDPFPFGLLALVVSSESVLLTIFVLISQNRMAKAAEKRSHLDLQVGMLAEQELTAILQMLQSLCKHAGVDAKISPQEVEDFTSATDVRTLASELDEKLPEV